jgi:hypothetical protein
MMFINTIITMFNNVAIDVAIGLVFIYLLYSLLATILEEIIAQILDLRARMLVKSIRVLLDDRTEASGNLLQRWMKHVSQNLEHFFCPLCNSTLSKAFYQHPTIKYLSQSSWRSKPSYIGAYNFSTTLIKMLRGREYDGTEPVMNAIYRSLFEQNSVVVGQGANVVAAPIGPETLDQIRQLYIDAQKDVDRFKALLERWFDETMDRTSGWYKRQSQLILFIIGLVLAIIFNVDTIAIQAILSKDKGAREQLVQLAVRSTGKYDTLTRQFTKVRTKDSTKAYVIDSLHPAKDSAFVWQYTYHDTSTVSDSALKDAYKVVMNDVNNANSILGLGTSYTDSCKKCEEINDSINCSTHPPDSTTLDRLQSSLKKRNCDKLLCKQFKWLQYHPLQGGGATTIIGWILTALAISLGAPFWFDILNKVIRLRAAGPKPSDKDSNTPNSKNSATDNNDAGSSPVKRVG